MKKESVNKVKLGVFIAIGIAMLATGIYFIGKSKQLFNETFTIHAMFKDVGGLQVGNNIRFAGINVGIVENIEIVTDTSVKVSMTIDHATKKFVRQDAKAIIGNDGLMGNKVININPGTPGDPEVKDGAMIATMIPLSMDDMMKKVKQSADNAALITDHLSSIFGNIREGKGTIGKIFMDEQIASNLNASIASLGETMVVVKRGATGFADNMEAAQSSFLLRGYFKKKEKEEGKNDSVDVEEEPQSRSEKRQERKALKEEKKQEKALSDSLNLNSSR